MARRRTTTQTEETELGMSEELAPGVLINTHFRGCTPGVIHTSEGVILIDTPMIPRQALNWRSQIEEEFPGSPFLYLINTDHHRGHALGNQYFMPCTVLAHERAHKEMSGYTENFKERVRNSFRREPEIQAQLSDIEIIPPDLTFTDRCELLFGDRRIELIFVGGHTPATSLVWLPEERICFVGDILSVDQHPYMAQGDSLQWLDALDLIRDLDARALVPGHGPVCGNEAIDRVGEYIRFMRKRVRDFYLEGKNKNETKSGLVSEMAQWFPIPADGKAKTESQIKSGLNRVYREMQREEEEKTKLAEYARSRQLSEVAQELNGSNGSDGAGDEDEEEEAEIESEVELDA